MIRRVFIVTGFLGSGKTTLALSLIRAGELQNAILIVNDFGDAPFDSIQIGATGTAYRSMDGGCICCTIKGDLVKTLHEIPDIFPGKDAIWIESSGISDPSELLQLFDSSSYISDSYSLQSVITVVDGRNRFDWLIQQESAPQQIAAASHIIINTHNRAKKDLELSLDQMEAFNPLALFSLMSIFDDRPLRLHDFRQYKRSRVKEAYSDILECRHQHENHGYVTHVGRWKGNIRKEDLIRILDEWIESIGHDLLRLKGAVEVVEQDGYMIIQGIRQQVTFDYEHVDWFVENFLVIIGKEIDKNSVDQLVDQIRKAIENLKLELETCQK